MPSRIIDDIVANVEKIFVAKIIPFDCVIDNAMIIAM